MVPVKLTTADLETRLEEIDTQLSEQGLPVHLRPLQAFKIIYGTVPDGALRNDLFEPISSWLIARYGTQAIWDGIVGRVPVLIRDLIYLVQVPFVSEDAVVKLTDCVENLPQDIGNSITSEEFEVLGRRMTAATCAFHSLYNLSVDDTFLDNFERGMVWRGLFDLKNAAHSLRDSGDTQNSVFQSHAAAEKFLKVALKRSGSTLDLKSLGHSLPKVFQRLIAAESRYDWLRSSVEELQKFAPDMQIRYGIVPRTVQNALVAFNAALSICGTLALVWLFDLARGTSQASFIVGRFYVDGSRSTFYCKQVLGAAASTTLAVLTRFDINGLLGATMIDMVVDAKYSALYLEVTDVRKIENLRRQLAYQMQNPGQPLAPGALGVEVSSGPEGSCTTAHVRVKL